LEENEMTPEAYREAVLDKIDDFLMKANEAVKEQPKDENSEALLLLIGNLGLMVSTLNTLKDTASFAAVANGLDDVLEKEFFSKVHGPREAKQESNPFEEMMKSAQTQAEKSTHPLAGLLKSAVEHAMNSSKPEEKSPETDYDIKAHIVGLDNPNDLPIEVRKKLAAALIQMGVPEEAIKKQLNLGGL
jgi:hypothetical protein